LKGKQKDITFTNCGKVAAYIKFKDANYFNQTKRAALDFGPGAPEPGSTITKLFQNVLKADLEMLFPNGQV
jgi:hypothetical protein